MFRKLKLVFKLLFALALIVFAGVPLLASTGWIRGKVEKAIGESLHRPVTLGSVSYWWFSGAKVKGLSVGGGDLAVGRVKVDPSLTKLLSSSKDIGTITVEDVTLRVVKRDDGSYSIPALEGMSEKPAAAEGAGAEKPKEEKKKKSSEPSRVLVVVAVRGVNVELSDERGAALGAWACSRADLAVDTGGGAGPMKITASAAGVLPSAEVTIGKDGMRATAKVDADLEALGKIVPVGPGRRFRSSIDFVKEGGKFTLTVKDTSASHGMSFSPDLAGDATMAAEVSGDLDAGWIRIEKPAEVHAGPLAVTVTGDMKKAADGNWDGAFTAKLGGSLPRPSAEVTASGRVEGEMKFSMRGGGTDFTADLRLLDVVFAQPGSPEIREKRVDIRAAAGKPAGGKFTISKAEMKGEGVSLSLLEPSETGGLVKGNGLLNRLQPFMPKVDWNSAGSFDLSARLVRGASGTKLTDIRATTGFLTVSGDAEFGGGASRVTLNLSGNLARLPKGLMPEKFAAEGTFTSGPITVTTGGGAMNASGSVAFRDFAVGGATRSATANLNFAVAKAGDSTRIEEVRFIADRTDVLLKGTMAGGRFEGALDARADLAIVPPSMLPKGYSGSGPMQAKLDIAGETGTLTASATGLRLTSETDQPMEFGEVRFTGRPSWRQGDKYATLADGRFTVANLKLRDYNITTGTVYPVTFVDGVLSAPTGDFAMNGGTIALRECTVDIRGAKPAYSLEYDVQKVQMAQRMGPEAKYLSPIFGGTSGLSGILQTKGLIADKGDANGLTGEVGLLLNEGTIKGSPVLTAILAWLKRETQLNFTEIAGNLKLGAGRIETAGGPLRIVAPDLTILLEGFTDMKGPVDYHVRVKFPEGSTDDNAWKKALKDGIIPMRLTGTLDSPSVAPPAIDKLAESVLDDIFKKGLRDGLGGLLPK